MNTFLSFICGICLGITVYLFFKRRFSLQISEFKNENSRLQQEKKIVVDFMHNLAVAIGEGVPKNELYKRITHTAVITTGAMSACIYEKTSSNRLQGVAVEGLFPPQRAIRKAKAGEGKSRARFLESILTSENQILIYLHSLFFVNFRKNICFRINLYSIFVSKPLNPYI